MKRSYTLCVSLKVRSVSLVRACKKLRRISGQENYYFYFKTTNISKKLKKPRNSSSQHFSVQISTTCSKIRVGSRNCSYMEEWYRVIKNSLWTSWLYCNRQVHRDFLITLYLRLKSIKMFHCYRRVTLTFKRRIKSHLPFADIIRSSPYSPRFQDRVKLRLLNKSEKNIMKYK